MIIVIGAGNIGRELLSKLSRDFDITCVDSNPESEEAVSALRGKERTKVIIGDATSRLVLEEAGVDDSDVVLITTTTEKINIEVARVLHDHFNPRRVISVAITEAGARTLAELGVEIKNIFTASANDIRNLIEHQAKTAHGIGIGKNEILEIEVHPNSRLRNRPLGYIAPIRWNIGIIYREGNIVIPKPETVLKEKDKVVILGDPAVLKTVAEMLTSEFERFPLEFGTSLALYLTGEETEEIFSEAAYIRSVFQLNKVHIVYSERARQLAERHDEIIGELGLEEANKVVSPLPPAEAIRSLALAGAARIGLIVVSKKIFLSSRFPFFGTQKLALSSLARAAKCPIILSQGTHPYSRLLVPALIDFDFRHLVDKSIEISHTTSTDVSVFTTKPSDYIATEEESARFEEAKKMISNMGFLHKKRLDLQVLTGNPVHEISGRLPDYNLLVLGADSWSSRDFFSSLLSPDVAWHILKRSSITTLILPGIEESL